jgi:hypothetical protein
MQSIIAEDNRIDVLVNSAGYPLGGAVEDLAMDEIKARYEGSEPIRIDKNNSSSSPNHEETEIRYYGKY